MDPLESAFDMYFRSLQRSTGRLGSDHEIRGDVA